MPASAPPATIDVGVAAADRSPHASPIAWPPVAQADTVVKFGPVIPNWMAIWPAPTFGMPIGMRNGLIRSGPRRALIVMPSTSVPTPPRPVPEDHPGPLGQRRPRAAPGRPAWSSASRAATSAELDVAVGPPDAPSGRGRAARRSRWTSPAIRDGQPRRVERLDRARRRTGRRPGPSHVRRRRRCRARSRRPSRSRRRGAARPASAGSSDQLPGADRRRAVDVAGQAAGRDRVGDRQRVELGALDLGRDLAVRRCRPAPTTRSGRRRRRSPPSRR